MKYPDHLLKLIESLKKLPGVGNKSAERYAFHLLSWPHDHLKQISQIIQEIPDKLKQCTECGSLIGEQNICPFCTPTRCQTKSICLVAFPRDVFAVESTNEFRGLYHVLGGVLSPLEGIHPEKLSIKKLKERMIAHQLTEVIIALDSTLEGDATALYLKQELSDHPVHITRLAFGLPMGSALDYVDGGTLARAFTGRARF